MNLKEITFIGKDSETDIIKKNLESLPENFIESHDIDKVEASIGFFGSASRTIKIKFVPSDPGFSLTLPSDSVFGYDLEEKKIEAKFRRDGAVFGDYQMYKVIIDTSKLI